MENNNFKKKSMIMATTFFILMMGVFVGILTYSLTGISKIESHLSKQEEIKLFNDLKQIITYCDNPLNNGVIQNLKIKKNLFDTIIIKKQSADYENGLNEEDINNLFESGETIIIIKKLEIIKSFKIDTSLNGNFKANKSNIKFEC